MNSVLNKSPRHQSKSNFSFFMIAFFVCALAFTSDVMAQTGAQAKVTTFFGSIQNILNAISVVVVTIAIIIAGYQIAFANKRIADVAPILIGGVLIGAATQIANLLISNT